MRAMILKRPAPAESNPLSLEEVPDPLPGQSEIQIEVRTCGVCHTDLHIVEGELPLPALPIIPGHQIVGVVSALGPGVARFELGERVGVPWLAWTCGKCDYCRRGAENLCVNARFTGYHVNGGFAEYSLAREHFAYPMPRGLSDVEAAPLLCAGIIGFRALRLSEVKPGQRLGFYGFGASAHVAIQIANYWGCDVYVFTRSKDHRDLALKFGAKWAGRTEETPPAKLHSAVIFAPAGHLVLQALKNMDKGATLALAGIYMTPIPEIDYRLLYDERTVRSVTACTREDAADLLRYAEEIPIRTETREFALEEANRVLQMLKKSEIEGAGVLKIRS